MAKHNYVLFDPNHVINLLPLAYTRPVAKFRIGIFTIQKKWDLYLNEKTTYLTRAYLSKVFPTANSEGILTYINGSILPNQNIVDAIGQLSDEECLISNETIIAYKTAQSSDSLDYLLQRVENVKSVSFNGEIDIIKNNWDIFQLNGAQIRSDIILAQLDSNKNHNILKDALSVKNKSEIYIEEGAEIGACILNAENGPIVIGKHAKILDGAMIKGPVSLGSHAVVKMGAKIYGDTTIGQHCKVGGEIGNSVLFGYSNKGHDGYLGNSVIGEWCNLGADTNTSNLKNNYSFIKCWSYANKGYKDTGLKFCGLTMGDHAKTGINTMLNTGTVMGVAANVFGGGFPPKFIPSFSWGGSDGFTTFRLEKGFEMAENMMSRRKIELTENDRNMLENIFEESSSFRV